MRKQQIEEKSGTALNQHEKAGTCHNINCSTVLVDISSPHHQFFRANKDKKNQVSHWNGKAWLLVELLPAGVHGWGCVGPVKSLQIL
jgi:hypothetical protein